MAIAEKYKADVEGILARRYEQGADYWTTPDHRLIKGSPFSTLNCAAYLVELGMPVDDPLLKAVAELIFTTWREDGRFKLYPKGAIMPCQTAHALRVLCLLGYAADERIRKTFQYFLENWHTDGGVRCNKFYFGRGPETESSNPLPTLVTLDAFRLSGDLRQEPALKPAVEFLLDHWEIRKPIGPCHYGMGTLFMQVEYPLGDYNLFYYVYVLSFYKWAHKDPRFLAALKALTERTVDGQIVPTRVNRKLAEFEFCRKNQISELATRRYQEILANLQ